MKLLTQAGTLAIPVGLCVRNDTAFSRMMLCAERPWLIQVVMGFPPGQLCLTSSFRLVGIVDKKQWLAPSKGNPAGEVSAAIWPSS